jgi:lipid-A-disaccharide synthase
MRRVIDRLLCIFPFEQEFFEKRGVSATYIGHPLAALVRPSRSRTEFFAQHRFPLDRPLVALLPGSRRGEAARHMPALVDAAARISRELPVSFVLARPAGGFAPADFRQPISGASIQVIEGETWDVLAHADLALAASGTVTIEAALLGTPMITFYKVTPLSWILGKLLVDVPFYSMVNLVAGRAVVSELMQNEMKGGRLASEALRLLKDPAARGAMRRELHNVTRALASFEDPIERAAAIVEQFLATRPGSNLPNV